MKDLVKSALVAATVLSGSMAYAGGPVIIEEGNGEDYCCSFCGSFGGHYIDCFWMEQNRRREKFDKQFTNNPAVRAANESEEEKP